MINYFYGVMSNGDQRPNIVLIHVDQWRADCLGFTGHPSVETPHLNTFFDNGVNFIRAYAAVPSCIASRASLMTGLTQRTHGRVGYRDAVPWRYKTTLASTLASAGYHTQAVGKMHVYPERNLLGFHNVILHDGYLHHSRSQGNITDRDDYLPWLKNRRGINADIIDTGMGCNGYAVAPWSYDTMEHPMASITTESIDFLRRRDPDKPFFLYTSYHRPHPPFDPPQEYLAMYENKVLPPPVKGDWISTLPSDKGFDSPVPSSEHEIDKARKAYYAQITFIDHQINRLLHAIHERNLLENTWIIFISDHGDMLYDHNHVAKSLPYEASARVPFLVRFPAGQNKHLSRATIDAPVEMRDIFPTICDMAGIPVPESVEGKSVLPFCLGERPSWREYIHGEHDAGKLSNHWITDGKWKYVWFSRDGREQLFNLGTDPQECHDCSTEVGATTSRFRQLLIKELTGREEGYVENGVLVKGKKGVAVLTEPTLLFV